MKLLDVVRLARDLPDEGLHAGDVGTIVHETGEDWFEVEFCDEDGRTVALLPLRQNDLEVHLRG